MKIETQIQAEPATPQPQTSHPEPQTQNLKPQPLNTKTNPETSNPEPLCPTQDIDSIARSVRIESQD